MDKFDHAGEIPEHLIEFQALLGGMELVPMLHLLMKTFDLSLNQVGFASEIDVSALHKILQGEHREFKAINVDNLIDELERLKKLTDPLEKEIWRRELRIAAFSHYEVYKAVEPRLVGVMSSEERKRIIAEYLRRQYPILVETYKRTQGTFPSLIPIELAIASRLLRIHSTSKTPEPLYAREPEVITRMRERCKEYQRWLQYKGLKGKFWYANEIPELASAGVPALIEALKDEDGELRSRVAMALRCHGQKALAAVPALTEALIKDENIHVRYCAADLLGDIGAGAAVPALTEALKDEDHRVRHSANEALRKILSKT